MTYGTNLWKTIALINTTTHNINGRETTRKQNEQAESVVDASNLKFLRFL